MERDARLEVVLVADDQHEPHQHAHRAQIPHRRLLPQHRKREQRAHEWLQALEARHLALKVQPASHDVLQPCALATPHILAAAGWRRQSLGLQKLPAMHRQQATSDRDTRNNRSSHHLARWAQ